MNKTKKLILSAMFIVIGIVLPFFTGQLQQIGNMLLPMHLPVFLCGLICGWKYGLTVGVILPLLRSMTFGMPPLFPVAIAMSFELATYGFVAGFLYEKSHWKCIKALYRSMIIAMIAGRVVWGLVEVILLGIGENGLTWQFFFSATFFNAIPGMIVQLTFIPTLMLILNKAKMVPSQKRTDSYKEVQL